MAMCRDGDLLPEVHRESPHVEAGTASLTGYQLRQPG